MKPYKLFGTDGIRGRANCGFMTAELAMKLGMAVASLLPSDKRHRLALIGKDTRLSCYMFEPAITAGLVAAGIDVLLVGPLPTPAVAMLTKSMRADLGFVISASHNPYLDNGIKIFNSQGYKLSPEEEERLEAQIFNLDPNFLAAPDKIGRVRRLQGAKERYIEFVKNSFPAKLTLEGLKIALDTANGAAYDIAGKLFWELGAEVVNIGNTPDGLNINDKVGATHPEALARLVVAEQCDIGIALDGDADRIVVVDEKGNLIDGDQIIALIATYLLQENKLRGKGVVTSVLSNLALENYLNNLGIEVFRTDVGDRYVAEEMRKRNCNLGGEQSGHIIISDYVTTGDALVASLQVISVMLKTNKKASEVCTLFTPYTQLKQNIPLSPQNSFEPHHYEALAQEATQQLGDTGRVIIRKSGTEPLIRVMAEGSDYKLLYELIQNIVAKV